jgi:hypothetical protein
MIKLTFDATDDLEMKFEPTHVGCYFAIGLRAARPGFFRS